MVQAQIAQIGLHAGAAAQFHHQPIGGKVALPLALHLSGHRQFHQSRAEAGGVGRIGGGLRKLRPAVFLPAEPGAGVIASDVQRNRAAGHTQCAILGGVGCQLVEHQRQRGRRVGRDRHIGALHGHARLARCIAIGGKQGFE